MKPLYRFSTALAMALGLSSALFSATTSAAPMCSGPTSVTDLGSEGCTFGELTFSDFNFSGQTGFFFDPLVMNPDDILVDIAASTLAINILESVPAIGLLVTPRDPAIWSSNGMFTSVSLALNYVVSAVGATIDQYQITGGGPSLSLRGPSYSASMAVDAGDIVVQTGSRGPFLQRGTVAPGTTRVGVTTTGGASPGIAGGSTFISSVRNVFTVGAAPVPTPGTFGMAFLGLVILVFRHRSLNARQAI